MSNIDDARKKILERIEALNKQIKDISAEIELDRKENGEDDASIRNELLDKKNIIESTIMSLMSSMNSVEKNASTLGKNLEVMVNGASRKFTIVHPTESDITNGKLSAESPLAKAMEGKDVGNKVSVETPNGSLTYEILAFN